MSNGVGATIRHVAVALLLSLAVASSAFGVASNYERSVRNVLKSEGGAHYTNHPRDPGGPTKYGITIHDVRLHLKPRATANDVRALSEDQALWIYREKYWKVVRGDELPMGVDYSVFDYGVNSGVARAGLVLRRALGLPNDTWKVTSEVIDRVNAADPEKLIHRINDERLRFLRSLRTWPTFGKGWGRRVASVTNISLLMASTPAGLLDRDLPAPAAGPGKGMLPEDLTDEDLE